MLSLPNAARCLVLLAVLVAAGGCSSKAENGKALYPVRGQVFFDKKPAAGAFVLFVPVNEAAEPKDPRPRGDVDQDGNFQLSTHGTNDGAPAGEYLVLITWIGPADRDEREDRLQGRYGDAKKPQFRATVKAGANELPPYHLK